MDDGIVVTGSGSVAGQPDVVRARLSASASRPTLADALAAADQAVRRLRAALAEHGVALADAATAGLSVSAEQSWDGGSGPRTTGYRAEHPLDVVLRDLPAAGAVLGDTLLAGGDDASLQGVEFAVADPAPLVTRARELAWADAAARAVALAGLAGRPLGPVLAVAEPGTGAPQPFAAVRMAKADAALDLAPGSVSVSVSLTVRWGLG